MAGRPCAGEGRDLTDDLPIDPYPGLICTEFFNTHACSQQLNERRHPSEHGKRTGPPLVVYADPLATMSPVRDNPSLSGAEQTAPCKVQEAVPELLFSAPASTWFEKQSYDLPQKIGTLSRFVYLHSRIWVPRDTRVQPEELPTPPADQPTP